MNRVKKIKEHGQSIWLDFLDRKVMDSGELQKYIEEDGISGLTSNPAIFEKAITGSSDYDGDLAELDKGYDSDQDLFFAIAIKDIRRAADIFLPIYEKTGGGDGFVSLEVSPALARDTTGDHRSGRRALGQGRQGEFNGQDTGYPGRPGCDKGMYRQWDQRERYPALWPIWTGWNPGF